MSRYICVWIERRGDITKSCGLPLLLIRSLGRSSGFQIETAGFLHVTSSHGNTEARGPNIGLKSGEWTSEAAFDYAIHRKAAALLNPESNSDGDRHGIMDIRWSHQLTMIDYASSPGVGGSEHV